MKSLLLASALIACASIAASPADAVSFKLHRQPHRYIHTGKPAHQNRADLMLQGRKAMGKTIPMNGGLVTQGAFFLNISVGSQGEVFDVIVDTGSSNTAVPSAGCTNCGTNKLYNASMSTLSAPLPCDSAMCQNCLPIAVGTDFVPSGRNVCPFGPATCTNGQCGFGFAYGGGGTGTEGTTVTDKVCFTGTNICTNNAYLFQLEAEFPTATQSTGILGLAYPSIACNPTCQPPILDALAAAGTLPNNNADVFGMCLTQYDGGVMDLGALDESRYNKADMMFTQVVTQSFFTIDIKDIEVNGVSLGVPHMFYKIHNDVLGSFVDSGTTVVLISPIAFQALANIMTTQPYSQLPGVQDFFGPEGCHNFDASTANSQINMYPNISFVVAGMPGFNGDFRLNITGQNYLMAVNGPAPAPGKEQRCLGIAGVTSIGVILGDVMMQNYYISFDRSNNILGFAPLLQGKCSV